MDIRAAGTTPGQIDAYAALLSAVFGESAKFEAGAIRWRYQDNPAGAVVGTDAWVSDTLAAHYVTCPVSARIEGKVVRGLLSLNTATHPDYQGRGLFTRLAEETYASGAEAGHQFVFGIANANSTPGFLRKLGFQLVAPLAAGGLLRAPRALPGDAPQFAGNWTPELLAWRLANPAARYKVRRHGGLLAVSAATHLPFVDCVAYLPDPGGVEPQGPIRPAASLFIGLEPRLDLGAHGFVRLPERLRPSPLNLIYRRLDNALPETISPAGAAINFLDFDPY